MPSTASTRAGANPGSTADAAPTEQHINNFASPVRLGAFAVVALLLVSFNLRIPLSSLPPVISEVSDALALTPAVAGLLTSVPVFAFAAFAVPSSYLIGKIGPEKAMLAAVCGVAAGQLVRASGHPVILIIGTILIGASITIGNVAVPVIVARDYRSRSAAITGGHSAMMNAGSTFATIFTAPMSLWWGWQAALASWALVAIVAACVWVKRMRVGSRWLSRHAQGPNLDSTLVQPATSAGQATPNALGRHMAITTALLVVAFFGQSGAYYAMTAWLPEMLSAKLGLDLAAAGGMSSPFQFMALAGALSVPFALHRGVHAKWVSLALTLLWISMPAGLLIAPHLAVLWLGMAGIAQGGNFTLIFSLVALRSPSVGAARRAATIIQTVGYAIAAAM
ncbi:MAG: MFS transporter, partial [Cellulomonadaceae bacterium]|nr:MFS transporter [Cellulomonadaceae bacterium]